MTAIILRTYGVGDERADLAERFLSHRDVINWSEAQTYQEHWETLDSVPFSDEQMTVMKERRDALIRQYGEPYKYDYGWAVGIEGLPKRPTFRDLERLAQVAHLRAYYRWASHEVHSDAKGPALNVIERSDQAYKLSGYTNAGLADPAQMALISLHQVTVSLLLSTAQPSLQDLVVVNAIQYLLNEACHALADGERSVEAAEGRYQAREARRRPVWASLIRRRTSR